MTINKAHLVGLWYFLFCMLIFGMLAGCKENSGSRLEYRVVSIPDVNGVIINFNCPVFNGNLWALMEGNALLLGVINE